MNEQEKTKATERATAYRDMMNSWAWKDFSRVMGEKRQDALEQAIMAPDMEEVQIARGIVKCIDSLNSEVSYILDGPK